MGQLFVQKQMNVKWIESVETKLHSIQKVIEIIHDSIANLPTNFKYKFKKIQSIRFLNYMHFCGCVILIYRILNIPIQFTIIQEINSGHNMGSFTFPFHMLLMHIRTCLCKKHVVHIP